MSASDVILWLMVIFMVVGALDRIFGNRLGLGQEFENGILALGSLGMAMLGILCLAPVLAKLLRPAVVPVYTFLGADPAMFAGTILACDMGGGALAAQLAQSPEAALYGGVIVGSMLGPTLVFTIPVALGILQPEDRPALARGILAGLVTIPFGAFVGGLTAGYDAGMAARNLLPIVLIALLIALGLWRAEKAMIRGFAVLGRIITALITVGLAAGIFEALTGIALIPGLAPLADGYDTIGSIAIVLAGAFPLVYCVTRLFRRPLLALGKKIGMNEVAAAGLVATLANSIPTFGMLKDMDQRGKVVNVAFAVSAAFVFGDHLGFAAGFAPDILPAMIVGKLTAGILSVPVALLLCRRTRQA